MTWGIVRDVVKSYLDKTAEEDPQHSTAGVTNSGGSNLRRSLSAGERRRAPSLPVTPWHWDW